MRASRSYSINQVLITTKAATASLIAAGKNMQDPSCVRRWGSARTGEARGALCIELYVSRSYVRRNDTDV